MNSLRLNPPRHDSILNQLINEDLSGSILQDIEKWQYKKERWKMHAS